jgi:hypothetical protein
VRNGGRMLCMVLHVCGCFTMTGVSHTWRRSDEGFYPFCTGQAWCSSCEGQGRTFKAKGGGIWCWQHWPNGSRVADEALGGLLGAYGGGLL